MAGLKEPTREVEAPGFRGVGGRSCPRHELLEEDRALGLLRAGGGVPSGGARGTPWPLSCFLASTLLPGSCAVPAPTSAAPAGGEGWGVDWEGEARDKEQANSETPCEMTIV